MAGVIRRKYLGGAAATLGGLLAAACGEPTVRYVGQPQAGPAGPAGPQGPKGATGAQGAQGAAGVTGMAPVQLRIGMGSRFHWGEDVGKEITDPLLEANPWLSFDLIPSYNLNKFRTEAAGGAPPDVYSSGSYWAQEDYVLGLTILLEDYIKTSKAVDKSDVWESLRLDVEFKGAMTAMLYAPDTRILYTHDDNARKAGIDPDSPPKSWSELEENAFKAFKKSGDKIEHVGWYPFWGSGGPYLWMVPYWQLGGELLNKEQTEAVFNNEQAITALTWLKKIVDGQGGFAALDEFRAKRRGWQILVQGDETYLHATLSERGETIRPADPNLQFHVNSYPLPDAGGVVANYGGCHSLPIAKLSQHPDEAWMFIEWVTNNANNIKFANRFDRVPVRISSTNSEAYIQGDAAKKLQAQEMTKRRFVIAAPGGREALKHQNVSTPVIKGEASIKDALDEGVRLTNEVLAKFRRQAEERGL